MFARIARNWVALGAVALVVSSLGVATTWSYLKTAWSEVGRQIRDATPISFDLKRLDQMIRDLEPEIRRNQKVVAQLEVEVEYLQREVAQMEAQQQKALAQMRKLREALRQEQSEYRFGDRIYTRAEVERDLARRLERYQTQQDHLAAKRQLLAQRRQTLHAAEAKVSQYRQQYENLLAKAEQLQAELKLAEAAAAAGELHMDGSKLAEAKELAREVETRIRVLQRTIDHTRNASEDEIPVEADSRPVTERFDELFGQK